MFVFTLMQSRTHVDTVQTVLHGTTSSSDICWSRTMKVLGSRVSFVRRNSAANKSLRDTFHVMKMPLWSRTFAVNVQSVSIPDMNWDVIIQYIPNTFTLWIYTNCFPVVYAIDFCQKTNAGKHCDKRSAELRLVLFVRDIDKLLITHATVIYARHFVTRTVQLASLRFVCYSQSNRNGIRVLFCLPFPA